MKKIIISSEQLQLLKESIKERLATEREKVNTSPTEGQAKAGNYAMGHITIHGFEISIENPRGSYRCGKDKDGKEWKTLMHNDYGYFTKTVGKDGDAIDVFLGPYIEDKELKIYPIDQYINGEFDETKVMMGFRDKESAKKAYLSNYEKDWKGFKYITEVDIDTFKKWLYDGYRQRKPFAKYTSLTESKIRKNDKNEIIPDKCDKCSGKIHLEIHGEPVYVCSECGKYFGTMPCNINENMINEKFNSNKLSQYATEHGGVSVFRNGGLRDGAQAWQHGRGIDLSQVTDDMIGEPFNYEEGTPQQKNNAVLFNDGTAMEINTGSHAPSKKSKASRYGTGIGDTGDHDKKPSPWVSNGGKTDNGPQYNGYGISDRAGQSQNYRQALKNNYDTIDYFSEHPERDDASKEVYDANRNIDKIHRWGKELRNVDENKKPRKIILTEEQFKAFCRMKLQEKRKDDYIKNLVKEALK